MKHFPSLKYSIRLFPLNIFWSGKQQRFVNPLQSKFVQNPLIRYFDELGLFTKVTDISYNKSWFYNCSNLIYVNIKNGIKFTSSGARTGTFESCSKLDHAILDNVTTMHRTFYSCNRLRWVVIRIATPPSCYDTTFPDGVKIYVPDELVESYTSGSVSNWSAHKGKVRALSQFHTDFPDDIEELGLV